MILVLSNIFISVESLQKFLKKFLNNKVNNFLAEQMEQMEHFNEIKGLRWNNMRNKSEHLGTNS